MLVKKSENMNKAVSIIKELSADEKIRYEADMRERAIRDYNSAMYGAHKQGVEESIEQAKLEMAKAMLKQGMDYKRLPLYQGFQKKKSKILVSENESCQRKHPRSCSYIKNPLQKEWIFPK